MGECANVAATEPEIVTAHAVLGFEMADDGLDGGPAAQFIFAVLGIFTFGIVFIPLAALCSVIGLLLAMAGRSVSGFGVSLLGAALTGLGFIFSPGLWLLVGGFLVAAQDHRSTAPNPAPPQPATSQQSLQTNFARVG